MSFFGPHGGFLFIYNLVEPGGDLPGIPPKGKGAFLEIGEGLIFYSWAWMRASLRVVLRELQAALTP